jgi:IS5 family transposase
MERYKEQIGVYPERGLADKIYRTRENIAWRKERGICLNGPRLGRPPKDKALYRQQLDEERRESGERNEIEGYIGVCKRRYGLDLVLMRLKHTSEADIHAAILTRNLFRRLRVHFGLILKWVQATLAGYKWVGSKVFVCLCA